MSIIPHHTSGPVCELCQHKLLQADSRLASWFGSCVKPNLPSAHISWTYRDQLNQDRAVADGKSKLKFPNSPHNRLPSLAIDLFELDQAGRAKWDVSFFSAINDMNERLNIDLLWGAHFKHLGDFDHFELHIPPDLHLVA